MTNTAIQGASAPITFQFQPHTIRVLSEDGEPWFCVADVCDVLGYANSRKALEDHCRAGGVTKRDTIDSMGRPQPLTYINEGNLYRLILKSRKPEAEKFEAWVCDELLPTIRKTGRYEAPQAVQPEPVTPEYLTPQQEQALSRCAYLVTNRMHHPQSVAHAFWMRLRKVAGVPSPGKFEVAHLPALAQEIMRFYAVVEAFREVEYKATQTLIKRVLRKGEDAAPILAEIAQEFDKELKETDEALQARITPWALRDIAHVATPRLELHG